jgi:peptidoglycan/xylan/chitin deacetylase (PgdA/CDA1 family)
MRAYARLAERLMPRSHEDRRREVARVREILAPRESPPRLTLSWDEVRRIEKEFSDVEIGVHTSNHLDLSACREEEAVAEIEESCREYEAALGRRPSHFAFPYSRSTPALQTRLAGLGLSSAMCGNGVVSVETDRFSIPRIEAPPSMSLVRFRTSSAYPDLSRRVFGRE